MTLGRFRGRSRLSFLLCKTGVRAEDLVRTGISVWVKHLELLLGSQNPRTMLESDGQMGQGVPLRSPQTLQVKSDVEPPAAAGTGPSPSPLRWGNRPGECHTHPHKRLGQQATRTGDRDRGLASGRSFLTALEAGSPRAGCRLTLCLGRAPILVCRRPPPRRALCGGGRGVGAPTLSHQAPPSRPRVTIVTSLSIRLQVQSHWGSGLQHRNLGRHRHSVHSNRCARGLGARWA